MQAARQRPPAPGSAVSMTGRPLVRSALDSLLLLPDAARLRRVRGDALVSGANASGHAIGARFAGAADRRLPLFARLGRARLVVHALTTASWDGSWLRTVQRPCRAACGALLDVDDLHLAMAPQDRDPDVVHVAAQRQVDRRVPDLQATDPRLVDVVRQPWVREAHLAPDGIDLEAEARLEHHEHAAGRPGLRRAGHRVRRRPLSLAAVEAAVELGEPVELEELAGGEEALEDSQGGVGHAVARQPKGHERIVVRPDRTVVVRHRVVAGLPEGKRAHTPPRIPLRAEECRGHARATLTAGDAAHQHLAGVRGSHRARLLLAVEGDRIRAELFQPERLLEPVAQLVRPSA